MRVVVCITLSCEGLGMPVNMRLLSIDYRYLTYTHCNHKDSLAPAASKFNIAQRYPSQKGRRIFHLLPGFQQKVFTINSA